MTVRAVGSVGRLLDNRLPTGKPWTLPSTVDSGGRLPLRGVNATMLYHRMWIGDTTGRGGDKETALRVDQLRVVADACRNVSGDVITGLHRRRAEAVTAFAARRCLVSRTLLIRPAWRLVVGHGEDSVHESALTMSTTYGVPIVPGSALKGLAAATARSEGSDDIERLFGAPRPGASVDGHRAAVTVLDALPTVAPTVVVDVLTPHVKPYYDHATDDGGPTAWPAEYHSPVPVRFLALQGTPLRTVVIGARSDVDAVENLLRSGLDEYGLGGKTAAGYGYCTLDVDKS